MARAQNTDFLHSMRFHVTATTADSGTPLDNSTKSPTAGFMSVSTPEATVEAVEYREGLYNFPRKFPGNTTVSDVTMQKGVARGDSTFWTWLKVVIAGTGEYRADLEIKHFDRRVLNATLSQNAGTTFATPARTYTLKEAFPIRHKVAADLDASTSDISIMELDVAYEYFEIKEDATLTSVTDVPVPKPT